MQMLNYSNASGVEYAGLTDGDKTGIVRGLQAWSVGRQASAGHIHSRFSCTRVGVETPAPMASQSGVGQPVAANVSRLKPEGDKSNKVQPRLRNEVPASTGSGDNWSCSLNSIDNVIGMIGSLPLRGSLGMETSCKGLVASAWNPLSFLQAKVTLTQPIFR